MKSTLYENRNRREPPHEYKVGDDVYLSTKNLPAPANSNRKFLPKFIGPFKITRLFENFPNATLELPESMKRRRISPTFHFKLLRPFHVNDERLFPNREFESILPWNMQQDEAHEWEVHEILDHEWRNKRVFFKVEWTLGDVTWEPLSTVNKLAALDDYLQLMGITSPNRLPR